ncbi:uncharacterized protein LOC134539257 [Bacillus rossius redtenbacheri]|uniref:uncharacterized protein LOC134539257 n=1 Tax=Bacillus rossius redtenbacheri TaxID=93214 RepID=UPI002FDDB48D
MTTATTWLLRLATAACLAALASARNSSDDNALEHAEGRARQGKDFLDWIGLGTGADTDPYLARANSACLGGDLSECFKSRALASLDDFFAKDSYALTENARVVRMPDAQLRRLVAEPYEFSTEPRADEPEWDQFVKFLLRKVERFVKSAAVEVQFPAEVTEAGRYSPRFVDEIAEEIDVLEDKHASPFSRKRLKKLLIPMLVILKLFKLKLLLFLPLILGLASFKKLLGFLALVVPGLIGFFKLCKPDLHHNYGAHGHSNYYHAPPHHVRPYAPQSGGGGLHYSNEGPSYYGSPYNRDADSYDSSQLTEYHSTADDAGSPVTFREQRDVHQIAFRAHDPERAR